MYTERERERCLLVLTSRTPKMLQALSSFIGLLRNLIAIAPGENTEGSWAPRPPGGLPEESELAT